jgi:D-erythro-7,8-dihydroneopterin triphosphate epimerase
MKPASSIHSLSKPARISAATIQISNLRLRTYIGFNPEEKTKQQDIIVNASIRYRADPAFASDDEADALNYKSITKKMIHHIENGRFHLLEKLTADALRFADSVSVTLSAER